MIKLSEIKSFREDIKTQNPYIYKDGDFDGFDPNACFRDQLATFLICEEVTDGIESIDQYFNDVYNGIDPPLFHNMVLSINDGLYLYRDGPRPIYCAFFDDINMLHKNARVTPHINGYKYEHILLFVNYFYMLISSVSVLFIEMTNYISPHRLHRIV